MKRLITLFSAALALTAACAGNKSICAFNDDDCDGVPDDLGKAYDKDGKPGPDPYDADGDGKADGWAVDSNCDGKYDALGLDTTGDGFVDSIDINPDGEPDIISTGSSRAVFNCDGSGGDGDGDVPATGGTPGDGDAPVPNWHAPVVSAAQTGLQTEFARWKNFFLKTDCGGGKLSVPMTDTRLVSEGMGYGMLIMANLGTQAEFDAMYATYRDAPKSSGGLMQWDCDACGTSCPASNGQPASDADLDAAMALLQAETRFGGGTYQEAARQLIAQIRVAVMKNCNGQVHVVAGEWDPSCQSLNPSYFSPGYYRAFAQVDTLGAGVWTQSIDAAYTLLASSKTSGPQGLWPDGLGANCFACNGYDACRVPWRLATDFAWSGEPRAASLLAEVSAKVDAQGMDAFSGGPNSAFYGSLALSGLAVSQAKADQHYNTWINANPLYDNAYYQGTLRLIYLMLAAGNFPSTLAQ